MKFHFGFGGPGRRIYRNSKVRASDYYRPRLYVTFGPLGNAVMSGFLAAVGGFLCLIGLLSSFFLVLIGGLFVFLGVSGVRRNMRAYRSEKMKEETSTRKNTRKYDDDIDE